MATNSRADASYFNGVRKRLLVTHLPCRDREELSPGNGTGRPENGTSLSSAESRLRGASAYARKLRRDKSTRQGRMRNKMARAAAARCARGGDVLVDASNLRLDFAVKARAALMKRQPIVLDAMQQRGQRRGIGRLNQV